MNEKRWFKITVRALDCEVWAVEAESEEEAEALFRDGKASLQSDEPVEAEVVLVEEDKP